MVKLRSGFPRGRLGGQLAWFALWAVMTAVGLYLTPNPSGFGTHTQLGLPPCPSTLLWARPCPGCGMTTSVAATLHGNFSLAFRAHPFGPLLYALFTASALAGLYGWLRGLRMETGGRAFAWSVGVLIFAYLVHGTVRFFATPPQPELVWSLTK